MSKKAKNQVVADYIGETEREGIHINGGEILHLKNGKTKPVTLAESAAIMAKLETQWGHQGEKFNCVDFDYGRTMWLKQVAKVLKEQESVSVGADGSMVKKVGAGQFTIAGPMAESFRLLASARGVDPETLVLHALREGAARLREQAAV